ncbi:MAG: hypothetical protein IJT39_07185 [Bacteroidales bacterium]|nr:hypothetical protein [Bacteroidales bacterium]
MRIKQTIGNKSLWQREKTLFLTSKMAPIGTWSEVFEWVDSLSERDTVVCFNSSEFEAEVLKALLVNHVPTILVVMDSFRDRYNVQIKQALDENRLLIVVLKRDEKKGCGSTPHLRNRYILEQVQHVVCGYVNPNGIISLLLDGRPGVTHLLDRENLRLVAEPEPKPIRWTVAEDKRLLRMFYDDMGIHAIHKDINRPYSTIYNRIKSLTMSDEVLIGREFEDYVVELFDIQHNGKLTLKEWRGDKTLPGIYPEGNSGPDLIFDNDGQPFAIECKWRSHMPKDITKELLPPERIAAFQRFAEKRKTPVYLILGTGGLPSTPEHVFFTDLSKITDISSFSRLFPGESVLDKVERCKKMKE